MSSDRNALVGSHPAVFRGDLAGANSRLVPLKNVGGFVWAEPGAMRPPPFVVRSRELLQQALPPTREGERLRATRYSSHIVELARMGVLRRMDENRTTVCVANYFAVAKDVEKDGTVLARAIFDLRRANTQENAELSILAAQQIVALLQDKGMHWARKKFRVLHGDASNWYYQIPLGNSNIVVIHDSVRWLLNVLPMGWQHSCFIGQSISWWVLLYRLEGDDPLGVVIDLAACHSPPVTIELSDGGAIILIYDSILIIASDGMAKKWYQRIIRNTNMFKVHMKYLTLEEVDAHFVFAGIEIQTARTGVALTQRY